MSREQFLEDIETELKVFALGLKKRGFPIQSIEMDTDDFDLGEPYLHAHIELDDNWFHYDMG